MGATESTIEKKIPKGNLFEKWEKEANIGQFYKLTDMVEADIVNILNDYKFESEYALLSEEGADWILDGTIFKYKYGSTTQSINGLDVYKTQHPENGAFENKALFNSNTKIYDTVDHWKTFRKTALLSKGYASVPNDIYWEIYYNDGDPNWTTRKLSWFEWFTIKFNNDKENMRSDFGDNSDLKTYDRTIDSIPENDEAKLYIESLEQAKKVVESDLEATQANYNKIYTNIYLHSYKELFDSAYVYYERTKYVCDLNQKGLLGLLDYYMELAQFKHMVYVSVPDNAKDIVGKILYDPNKDGALPTPLPDNFKASENSHIMGVLKKKFNNNEKQILNNVFVNARRNNYIRLINTYLQICALVLPKDVYDLLFNTTNGYVKTLPDEELAGILAKHLASDYYINEKTSVDNKYVYGILSWRVIVPKSSLQIVSDDGPLVFNANRRDLQLKEFYIIQILKWLINDTTNILQVSDTWKISFNTDIGGTRSDFLNELYLNDWNEAIKSIEDIGKPIIDKSGWGANFITDYEKYNNDYNTIIQAYNFATNKDHIAEFKTYSSRSTPPITDLTKKLKNILAQQTNRNATSGSMFPIDYYAYKIIIILNGIGGWSCFKDILNAENMLISYALYYYTKQYEKWINKYCSYQGFTRYFDEYMEIFHDADTNDPDGVGVFSSTTNPYSMFDMVAMPMYQLCLKQSNREVLNKSVLGPCERIYTRWSLLHACMHSYKGKYREYYDLVSYLVEYYGKWLNLLFTEYIPASDSDVEGVKQKPLSQERNNSLLKLADCFSSYLYDVFSSEATSRKILHFNSDYTAEQYVMMILEQIAKTLETVNVHFKLDKTYNNREIQIKLASNTTLKGFDKKEIFDEYKTIMESLITKAWRVDTKKTSMPAFPDKFKKVCDTMNTAKQTLSKCSGDCTQAREQYRIARENYLNSVNNAGITICQMEKIVGNSAYKTANKYIEYVQQLMTVSYFLLYFFCSEGFTQCDDIATAQLCNNKCYSIQDMVEECYMTVVSGGFNTIQSAYNTIKTARITYGSGTDKLQLSELMGLFALAFNANISPVYNNAVRTYYEKFIATKHDEQGGETTPMITQNVSELMNCITLLQHNVVEGEKSGK